MNGHLLYFGEKKFIRLSAFKSIPNISLILRSKNKNIS